MSLILPPPPEAAPKQPEVPAYRRTVSATWRAIEQTQIPTVPPPRRHEEER